MRTFVLAVTGLVFAVAACSSYGTSVVEVGKTKTPVASVSLTIPSSLAAGRTARAVATPKDANGTPLTDRPVTWYTSSASIAAVNDSGMISAVAPGTAVVSAVSEGVAGTASMAVTPPPPTPVATVSVAVSPPAVLVGQTAQATATLQDSSGNLLSGRVVTWASSNVSAATVQSTGAITAVGAGSTMITATSEGKTNSAPLSVSAPAPIPVASVAVSPASTTLQIGGTVQLSATTRDASGNVLTGRVIGWTSANSSIARVSSAGLVTAVAAGTVSITVASEGQSASAAITVSAPAPVPVASVSVSPATATLQVGGSVQLSATTRDANGNVLTGRVVGWNSGNSSIATVSSSGLVTAVAAGSVTITAASEGQTASAAITVSAPAPVPVASVSVSPASSSLLIGATVQLSAVTRDANSNVLTGRVISWTSGNTGIATVSGSGLVKAVAAGPVTITATSETKTGTAAITVAASAPVPVASVSVSPGTASVQAGSTVQLTAVTRDASGNVLSGRVVTWSSGTIGIASVNSSSGLVLGIVVGSATVTATSEGMSGSAAITVTAAPPPGGSGEPSGMTVITSRAFNSTTAPNYVSGEGGWYDFPTTPVNFTIVTDATAPKSPSSVAQIRYPAGFTAGGSPGGTERPLPNGTHTVYTAMWIKLSSNFYGQSSSTNKVSHVWINGINRAYTMVSGTGSGSLVPRVGLQQLASSYNAVAQGGEGIDGSSNLNPNVAGQTGVTFSRGVWHKWEVVLYGGTPGNADGTVDWWLDGVKIGHYTGIPFVSSGGSNTWDILKWDPTWGGIGGTVPADMYMWMDHFYISGKP